MSKIIYLIHFIFISIIIAFNSYLIYLITTLHTNNDKPFILPICNYTIDNCYITQKENCICGSLTYNFYYENRLKFPIIKLQSDGCILNYNDYCLYYFQQILYKRDNTSNEDKIIGSALGFIFGNAFLLCIYFTIYKCLNKNEFNIVNNTEPNNQPTQNKKYSEYNIKFDDINNEDIIITTLN